MLSPTTGYAALALALLAKAGGQSVRVQYVADRCGIPGPYLSKIIHTLARNGLVGTRRGVGGGAWLAADAREITLLRLCELLDDPVLERSCLLGLPMCRPDGACSAREFCGPQRDHLVEYLRGVTLADFAERIFGDDDARPDGAGGQWPRVIRSDRFGPRQPPRA
ncbi:MAG: Rrf2 family transcriptional regulator [Phycisphaeraceae bacterium]|nr:MAG: Rrf2 family transcriptional regulator [Phycisphaeraceae bacterium]